MNAKIYVILSNLNVYNMLSLLMYQSNKLELNHQKRH